MSNDRQEISQINYKDVGLRVGLEIHQQLDTNRKLFCYCKPELKKREPDFLVVRYMRPTLGETGEIDIAALKEFEKGKRIVYETYLELCPYEVDEIPPFEVDSESLKIALLVAKIFKMKVPNVLMVSRKQYLDGSVPAGFQRTILVGLDGELELSNGKKIKIIQLCLEEDAARKIRETDKEIVYRVDRLGIPLLEITTGADMTTPEEVLDAALRIGAILRSTGKARRGIGTIRQDINVSIRGGARVEIKGVQEPELFKILIDNEIRRQLALLEIKEELLRRGVRAEDILKEEVFDATKIFEETKAKFIRKAISRGEKVLAIKLPKFGGILGKEILPKRRFGKEFAERVSVITGLKGIIHTDELPAYGISEKEKLKLFELVNGDQNVDCVVIVVGPEDKAKEALEEVKERAILALKGVPEETRRANLDGTTSFERPLGTAARLYPDTDSPNIVINEKMLKEVEEIEIELPWEKEERYIKMFGLSRNWAHEIVLSKWVNLFEELVEMGANPKLVASTLIETLKSLRRDGVPVQNLVDEHIKGVFKLLIEGKMAKEAIPEVLRYLSNNPEKDVEVALKEIGIKKISLKELEKIIDDILERNKKLIVERKERAFSPLMGEVMKIVRGKIDGKIVSDVLMRKIREFLKSFK